MKLLQEFKNEYNNITYRLYELDCGIKLIHLENPATVNFDFSIVHKAGCIYEDLEKVPHGTAHLLEHMLYKPNSKFKDLEAINRFESGNKNKPKLYINGGTGKKFLCLDGGSNHVGTDPVLERVSSLLDFPHKRSVRQITKEKKIVSAERSMKYKIEKDSFLQELIFLENDTFPEFTYAVLGELDDIKQITIEDLKTYFNRRFVKKNVIFTIQSKDILNDIITRRLETLGNHYPEKGVLTLNSAKKENSLKMGFFHDDRATGTSIELIQFDNLDSTINYSKSSKDNLLHKLINKLGYDLLREKHGLIYTIETYVDNTYIREHKMKSIKVVFENSKIKDVLKNFEHFIFEDLSSFINSSQGDEWFEDVLSRYIFPLTINYSHDAATEAAKTYFEYGEMYNYNKYVDEAKKITKTDLLKKIRELQSTPPHIWVESNLPQKEVEKIVKESTLWKRFK